MKNICVYDIEYKQLETVCNNNDLTMPELIEMLCEHLEDVKEENDLR